MKRKKVI